MITLNHSEESSQIWIGLIVVTGPPENEFLDGCLGAYVNVLSYAKSYNDYRAQIEEEVNSYGLTIEDIEWAKPLEERLSEFDIESYLLEKAEAVRRTKLVHFGQFHGWLAD